MAQKMVWKRLGYGMSKKTADEVLDWARKQGDTCKLTHGKMGWSVLCKYSSHKKR